jgi:tellurite resistance protein TerC
MVLAWIGFVGFILAMLALDLGVLQRRAHAVSMREAFWRSAAWITLGLSFSGVVYFAYELHWFGLGLSIDSVDDTTNDGTLAMAKYLTGYIVEQSLSVDNIFVMVAIFAYFGVAPRYQHRVLFWGIIGAMALRGVMIGVGATLIERFHWILYAFGVFLLLTGIRMVFVKLQTLDMERNPIVALVRRVIPVTTRFHGQHFAVRAGASDALEPEVPDAPRQRDSVVETAHGGTLLLTPLGLALVVVEISDVVFAVDSIPAVFAITADPFLVFTSNVFAILGLRSMYFAVAGLVDRFRYLNISIALVLVVVGIKMLIAPWFKSVFGAHSNFYLLGIIVSVIAIGIFFSWRANARDARNGASDP